MHICAQLTFRRDVPVKAERGDECVQLVDGIGLLLFEVGGVFALGLEAVFSLIQSGSRVRALRQPRRFLHASLIARSGAGDRRAGFQRR